MVRHLIYFETLGSLTENSKSWRRVFAGLVVLRLVDLYRAESPTHGAVDDATIESVRSSILSLEDSDIIRPILLSALDAVAEGSAQTQVCVALGAYGRALDLEASWRLAADVFETVASLAPAETHPLAIDANTMLGGVSRRAGDWDRSAGGYASAAHAAAVIGDTPRALKAEIGMANTHLAHGNLPGADEMLQTIETEAREQELTEILGLALHDRAIVAQHRGDHSNALEFGYEALKLDPIGTERDGLLEDMAASFAELGMRDAARDAHLIVSATSQSSQLVSVATLNLMELAALDGMEQSFDGYAAQLAQRTLDVRVRAYYLLYLGQGQQKFGRLDAAINSLEAARQFARANDINQVVFEADKSLSTAAKEWATWPAPSADEANRFVSPSTSNIARELTQMRELALAKQ
jgi:tetratricopeptide (TPR) repeat protein